LRYDEAGNNRKAIMKYRAVGLARLEKSIDCLTRRL
jgi:hypothetical protein